MIKCPNCYEPKMRYEHEMQEFVCPHCNWHIPHTEVFNFAEEKPANNKLNIVYRGSKIGFVNDKHTKGRRN